MNTQPASHLIPVTDMTNQQLEGDLKRLETLCFPLSIVNEMAKYKEEIEAEIKRRKATKH
ncbi:MAG: hypothetical protein INF43_01545 [Alphaproteobacteria bacterium]|nr:hypothetical protein [Alphaproteobacteria bacterium]